MKIALIKLGCRLAYGSTCKSGGVLEALAVVKMMNKAGINVDIYDRILDKDDKPDSDKVHIYDIFTEWENINNRSYDALIVLNGNVTYFGGEDRPHETLKYCILNKFDGQVFYVIGDFNLILTQIYEAVIPKSWSSNYNIDDIKITRKDIIYISQGQLTNSLKLFVNNSKSRNTVKIKNVVYFPLEKFPFLVLDRKFNENPEYDIIYGGNFRSGKREDDMIKYYFGYPEDIKVKMFGHIKLSDFTSKKIENLRAPEIDTQAYDYIRYCDELHKSKSLVIIGDKADKQFYKIAARVYECVSMGVIIFIDKNLDFDKKIFKNQELRDFCYVSSREEIEERLKKLDDVEYRRHLANLQWDDTYEDMSEYANSFKRLLEDNINA